jgi:hypothetical protein
VIRHDDEIREGPARNVEERGRFVSGKQLRGRVRH